MIKKIILSVILTCCLITAASLTVQAANIATPGADCTGNNSTGSSAVCTDSKSDQSTTDNPVIDRLQHITQILAYVAGASAVILILVGAINYVTADGDSNQIKSARDTIIYALIGLIVIVLATAIIEFVLSKI